MDAQLLYRTKLEEMEREARRVSLVAAAREAPRGRPASEPVARRRPPMPLRLLRALRPSS